MITRKSMLRVFAILIAVGFVLAGTVILVSARPLAGTPAIDGDGLMAVTPTTITYGGNSSTLVFTFTANADFGAGTQVKIDIPTGWTTPTTASGAGHISWNTGTCTLSGAPPVVVSGRSILIDIASCPTNAYFTVTYANVTPGPIPGSPYTFVTWTDIGPGGLGLVAITAPSPTVAVNPLALTVSAAGLTPADKIYDSTTATTLTIGSPALVGVVSPDVVTLVTTGATANFVDSNVGLTKTIFIAGLTLTGTNASNYTLIQPTRTATISKRSITVSAVNDVKTYDGGVSSSGVPTITVGALQGSDTVTWTQTFNNRHTGLGNKVLTPAGVINDGNGGNNYAYTYTSFNLGTINKKPITVTAVTDSKVYDGSTSSSGVPQITPGLLVSDTAVFTQAFDTKDAGTGKTLTPSGIANDGNGGNDYAYTFMPNTTGVISAATPTLSVTNQPITYDGLSHTAVITSSVAGALSDIRYNGSLLAPTNVGIYSVTAVFTPTDTLNYNSLLPGAAGSLVIVKATPTLSVANSPITYDGLAHAAVITSSVAGALSDIRYNGSSLAPTNVGIYSVTAVFTPTDVLNYNSLLPGAAGSLIILKATPTLSMTNSPITYDGLSHTAVITSSVAGAISDIRYNGSSLAPTNVGIYSVTAVFTPTDTLNYNSLLPGAAGSLVIVKATPTLSVTNSPITYDGLSHAAVITSSVAGALSDIRYNGSVITPTGAGTYTVTAVFTPTDTLNYNSLLPGAAGSLIILKATPTLSMTNSPITYDGLAHAAVITSSVTGALSDIRYNGSVITPTNAGTYTVTAVFTPSDTLNYNSLLPGEAGSLIILKATPTLSVTNSPITYDGLAHAAVITSSVAGAVSNIHYNGSATIPIKPGLYAVTADFTSSDPNYADLVGVSAGNFFIRALIYMPLISR